MDLSFIQEQLDTFDTFAGSIGDALQLIPELLRDVFGFFVDFESNSETTQGAFDGLSSADIGGSLEDDAPADDEGSSLPGSSE